MATLCVFGFAAVGLITKLMFIWHPKMDEFQFLGLRAIVHLFISMILLNRKIKELAYDCITKNQFINLLSVSLQVFFAFYCSVQALEALPLVEYALVLNTVPIFVAIFGYFTLGHKLDVYDLILLLFSFIGVFILMIFNDSEESMH